MKAIICARGSVEIFSFTSEWTLCRCERVAAKWLDPRAGTVVVATKFLGDREYVKLLGLNNQLLVRAVGARGQSWEDYRDWHDLATDAAGYIFDKSRASCWAVVAMIGTTNDVRWATDEEYAEAFPA